MKTLELEPLEKNLRVILVEKEYEEQWDIDQFSPREEALFRKPTTEFCETLKDLVEQYDPDFATDERGTRSDEEVYKGKLADLFESEGIRFELVEMDDYAKPYLAHRVSKIEDQLDDLMDEYSRLYTESADEKTQRKLDKMLSYGQYLQQKYEEELDKISYPVRQKWMAMGILDIAGDYEKESVTAVHLCSPSHMVGMRTLLESQDVEVESVKLEKEIKEPIGEFDTESPVESAESFEVQVVPKLEPEIEEEDKDVLIYFDTDESPSPFDILMAYDAGFDQVVPYSNVTADGVQELVQDAIFPRGPEGVKHTSFFISGTDDAEIEDILEATKNAMFPPFEASVFVDPKGANTTASALVGKVEKGLIEIGEGNLEDKEVVALAGTGPVGRVAAQLCAGEGADVTITSRREEKAKRIAEEISSKCGHKIGGLQGSNDEEIFEAVKDADVIISAGPEGIRVISEEILKKLEGKTRIVADANAVPPTGVEGLDSQSDMEEFMDGIYGIGALATGNLKNEIEGDLLAEVKKSDKGTFDHQVAFELAKEKLLKPEAPAAKVS